MTITLVSYSTCKKRKACDVESSLGVSFEVIDDDRIWTTVDYSNEESKIGRVQRKKSWKNVISNPLFKNSPSSIIEKTVSNESAFRISIDGNRFEAAAGNTKSPKKDSTHDFIMNSGLEYEEKVHKIRFWCNKRIKGVNESSSTLPEEAICEKYVKKHRIRRWLNKENPNIALAERIKKVHCDISSAAVEAANVGAIRNRAKGLAKASAFAAAGFARVVAEEMSPHASHGSIAHAISNACMDVAKTSLVQKADNGDYLRLFRLFHYHYKFRGPGYYIPLEPCCYYTKGPNGESEIHCKMDEPVETFRSSAVAKNSPFVLFLKQVAEERRNNAEADTSITATGTELEDNSEELAGPRESAIEKNDEKRCFKPSDDKQFDKNPVSELCNLFSTNLKEKVSPSSEHIILNEKSSLSAISKSESKSDTIRLGTCSERGSPKLIANDDREGNSDKNSNCEVDITRILTPVEHFLESFNMDIRGRHTLPRISNSSWFDRTSSQCRTGLQSHCFSIKAGSVDMIT